MAAERVKTVEDRKVGISNLKFNLHISRPILHILRIATNNITELVSCLVTKHEYSYFKFQINIQNKSFWKNRTF